VAGNGTISAFSTGSIHQQKREMILYHGSNVEVKEPKILEPSHALDFGPGFYTTLNRDQAVDFAQKVVLRKGGVPVVNEYEIDEKIAFEFCDLLKFDQPNGGWLDFVCSCRDGINVAEGRDLIFGPVANDDVYRTLTLYREGEITKEETLSRLKIKQLYNQLVFATGKALTFIRFRKSEVIA
jgi:hypothetical protein